MVLKEKMFETSKGHHTAFLKKIGREYVVIVDNVVYKSTPNELFAVCEFLQI